MITPKEAAQLVDNPNPYQIHEIHEFVLNAPARDVQLFSHLIRSDTRDAREWKDRARMAVDIRIAHDMTEKAESLEKQIIDLTGIAAEQKRFAAELDGMTKKLINLTVWLKWLTVALVALTCVLCLSEFRIREPVPQISFNPAQSAPDINQSVTNTP